MTGGHVDPYAAYSQQAASTASPAQLVLMLYDGVLARIGGARLAMESGDVAAAHIALGKAQAIVTELDVTLDRERGGDVAVNLGRLYAYCSERLVAANVAKDPEPLDEVVDVFAGLRESWERACVGGAVAVAG